MLKADLHMHTKEDPYDGPSGQVELAAKEMIDLASRKGFDVIAITNHRTVTYSKELADYAKSKRVLLIPGAELSVGGKDVLVYDITQEEADGIKKLSDLSSLGEDKLVIAPHPFFIKKQCLGRKLEKYVHLFHAVEYSSFYFKMLNLNRKAELLAEKHNLPLVGTSDSHRKFQMGYTYSVIDSEKDKDSVIRAIKDGRVRVITKPLPLHAFLRALINSLR